VQPNLADVGASSRGRLCLTRNTTESLDWLFLGIQQADMRRSHPIRITQMLSMFDLQARSAVGFKINPYWYSQHPENDAKMRCWPEKAIYPQNSIDDDPQYCPTITGPYFLRLKENRGMAHSHGVEVMVDGAHCSWSLWVFNFSLGCVIMARVCTNRLSVPLGAGMLFVEKGSNSKLRTPPGPFDLKLEILDI